MSDVPRSPRGYPITAASVDAAHRLRQEAEGRELKALAEIDDLTAERDAALLGLERMRAHHRDALAKIANLAARFRDVRRRLTGPAKPWHRQSPADLCTDAIAYAERTS